MIKKLLILSALLSGCSVFADKTQTLYVSANHTDATIFVNDKQVGTGYVKIVVPRDESVMVEAHKPGYEPAIKFVQTVPSLYGKLDTAGTYFLIPAIGLFTPGAFELETDQVVLTLKK